MRIALLLAAAGLAAQPAAAQLYKCVQGGKVVYQDSPCDQNAKQSTVRTPEAGPAPAAADPAAEKPAAAGTQNTRVDVESVIAVLSGFQACANDLDGYAAKYNAGYNAWRTQNVASIARYNQDAEAQKRVRSHLEEALKDRPRDAQALAGRSEVCDANAQRWFTQAKQQ